MGYSNEVGCCAAETGEAVVGEAGVGAGARGYWGGGELEEDGVGAACPDEEGGGYLLVDCLGWWVGGISVVWLGFVSSIFWGVFVVYYPV